MDYRKALRLLQLPDDSSVQSAEAQFETLSQELEARQAALSETSDQWRALTDELAELKEAIEAVRQPRSSIERAGAALLAGYSRELSRSELERSLPSVNDSATDIVEADIPASGGSSPERASEALSAELAPAPAPGLEPEPDPEPQRETGYRREHQAELTPEPRLESAAVSGDVPTVGIAADSIPARATVAASPATMPPVTAMRRGWTWAWLLLAIAVAALVYRLVADRERPVAIDKPPVEAGELASPPVAPPDKAMSAAERNRLEEDRVRLQSWAAQLLAALAGPPPAVSADQWSQLTRRHVPELERLQPTADLLAAAAAEAVTTANVEGRRRMLNAAGDLLDAQSKALTRLFEAVRARSVAREQWQRLNVDGLTALATAGDSSTGVAKRMAALEALREDASASWEAGELSHATERYGKLALELTAIEPDLKDLADRREREIERLYTSGMEAISRYHLSTPAEGSALQAARRMQTLSPGRQETAALTAAIQDAYVRLLQAALGRNEVERAERYANLAAQLGVSSAIIDEVYRSAGMAAP